MNMVQFAMLLFSRPDACFDGLYIGCPKQYIPSFIFHLQVMYVYICITKGVPTATNLLVLTGMSDYATTIS